MFFSDVPAYRTTSRTTPSFLTGLSKSLDRRSLSSLSERTKLVGCSLTNLNQLRFWWEKKHPVLLFLTYISSFVCMQMWVHVSVCDVTWFWEQTDSILCCFCCGIVHTFRSLFSSVVSTGVSLATVAAVCREFPVTAPWLLSCKGHISCHVCDGWWGGWPLSRGLFCL